MKAGLCLSGGGAKGGVEVGALEYVADHPDLFPNGFSRGSGCSVGGVNMGGLAQFVPGPDQARLFVEFLVRCWERLGKTEDVWTKRFPPYMAGLWNPSIGDNTPLRTLVTSLIDMEKVKTGTPCEVAAWDLLSGTTRYYSLHEAKTKQELVSYILASCSFPLAFPPEQVGDAYCTDGGIVDIAPAGRLVKAGCDHILAIVCRNPKVPEPRSMSDLKTVLGVGLRCLDGMESEIVRGDLEQIRLWNLLVEAGHAAAKGKRHVRLDVVVPIEPLGDPLDFSPTLTKERRRIGYASAKAYFEGR